MITGGFASVVGTSNAAPCIGMRRRPAGTGCPQPARHNQTLAGRTRPFTSRPTGRPPQSGRQRQHFRAINRHVDELVYISPGLQGGPPEPNRRRGRRPAAPTRCGLSRRPRWQKGWNLGCQVSSVGSLSCSEPQRPEARLPLQGRWILKDRSTISSARGIGTGTLSGPTGSAWGASTNRQEPRRHRRPTDRPGT
jgi:hypothetical protein